VPLAFPTQSHGTIAFGFFNIELDLLLLEQLFFFADSFCEAVVELSSTPEVKIDGWRVPRGQIGDLHGAIAGVALEGFIGATYRKWPFPRAPEDFKQSPEGVDNQPLAAEMIADFGGPEQLALRWSKDAGLFSIAGFDFSESGFERLLDYVDRGGYPRWRDDIRPDYVERMKSALMTSGHFALRRKQP